MRMRCLNHYGITNIFQNIQVTSSEILGVEDRGGYYESSGALKDMVQNHMLQMVALLAMEAPISLNSEEYPC
ncbi:Glucose-6-phosphate 1-dehydrogenase [Staphylococcus aureus]|uniref:Glucose-6-phosphate 1-dehydrogenase n=1 Tax=Staphylococcus aureus TaxID=1280 RepID=A0A380E1Q2_STAAU|nr:Glucose-6-phosphate 1-dehydrogenase [Staphylococcus aureus]